MQDLLRFLAITYITLFVLVVFVILSENVKKMYEENGDEDL